MSEKSKVRAAPGLPGARSDGEPEPLGTPAPAPPTAERSPPYPCEEETRKSVRGLPRRELSGARRGSGDKGRLVNAVRLFFWGVGWGEDYF